MTRYELLDRIGVGGMAEIFRGKAVAAGGFEKPVAIKRILPHLSQDTRFVELLIAEAKVLSLLKHRNIVQIFDVGLGDDGKYFLVMEFVDGKDLGAVQRTLETSRRRIPFDLVLHIGAEICEALEHAHAARSPDGRPMSLVHRDVSPSNVLLSRAGEVKLTDFGIAKRAEQDATQGGAVRGKFAYISPEQARAEQVDPRSDVFSVGILLWELVTNRRLFSGLDDLAALRAVREGHVPPPSETDPRLPPDIDRILAAATARDRARRFASAGQLGAELRSLRYSLDVTVGDPATELAKIVEATEEAEREAQRAPKPPMRLEFDAVEATVIRIRTADAFSARDNDASIVRARAVIDRFEEEETRLAQLSGDQLRMLRSRAPRDSAELTAHGGPPRRAPSEDEATRTLEPIDPDRVDTPPTMDSPVLGLEAPTRIVAPLNARGPRPPTNGPPAVRGRAPTGPPPPFGAPPTLQGLPPVPHGSAAAARRTPPPGAPQVPPPLAPMPPGMPMGGQPMGGQPMGGQPMGGQPMNGPGMPGAPPMNAMNGPYAGWAPPVLPQRGRDATPTTHDAFDRPVYPSHPMGPQVAGFQRQTPRIFRPWLLIVGALVMATLAYIVTRAFLR